MKVFEKECLLLHLVRDILAIQLKACTVRLKCVLKINFLFAGRATFKFWDLFLRVIVLKKRVKFYVE